jgi:hypothetical protein
MKENQQKANDNSSRAMAHQMGNGRGISVASPFQSTLTAGTGKDPLEPEAAALAAKVTRMPDPNPLQQASVAPAMPYGKANVTPLAQKKCSACGQEEKLQKKEEQEEYLLEDKVQKKPLFKINEEPASSNLHRKCAACELKEQLQTKADTGGAIVPPGLESRLRDAKGLGLALSDHTRQEMESAFDAGFAKVRIHTDGEAVQMSRALQAHAFTYGQDIYFNEGRYDPNSSGGTHLLAHELTHTLQQRGTTSIQRVTDPNFAITGISPAAGAVGRERTIFFDMGSSTIGAEEPKITTLAANTTQSYDLEGFASEEGSDVGNRQLTAQRIQAVSDMLRVKGHTAPHNPSNSFSKGTDRLDYQEMRKVEVRDAGAVSSEPTCRPTAAVPHPETIPCHASFTTAHPEALTRTTTARDTMSSATGPERSRIEAAVAFFFGSASHYATILTHLNNHVIQVADQSSTVQCHNECDATCRGAIAYMPGTTGPGAILTLCPSFIDDPSLESRVTTLIHEAFHATSRLATRDLAYAEERGFTLIDPAIALRNTDTYVAFINEILHPGSVIGGSSARDFIDPSISGLQLTNLRRVMAYLEKWVMEAGAETSSLYEMITQARRAHSWSSVSHPYYEDTMIFVADIFGLNRPPATPTEPDQVAVAGINHRLMAMSDFLWGSDIRIDRNDLAPVQFAPGPAEPLLVNDAFLHSGQHAMAYLLVSKIVEANTTIASSERPKYVDLIERVRLHSGHSAP